MRYRCDFMQEKVHYLGAKVDRALAARERNKQGQAEKVGNEGAAAGGSTPAKWKRSW